MPKRPAKRKLADSVFSFLKSIPCGKVSTYARIAKTVGTHPRVVASILRNNKNPNTIPCYKVVMSDGLIGGYSGNGGVREKIRRLRSDGVTVKNGKVSKSCFYSP
jgi:O-6-methylguanine DNA methyltransferase